MDHVVGSCHCAGKLTEVDPSSALYSVRQVADQLGVHPETVRRLIHDGRLEAVRIGRVLRIHGAELDGFLARQRVKPQRH
ncbi:MAG TPA: helix-turn-helix domain-containing protein [Gaiellaceae bacterium]